MYAIKFTDSAANLAAPLPALVSSEAFLAAATAAASAAERKSSMPILACVLVAGVGQTLVFSATDLFASVRVTIDVSAPLSFATCIDARDLVRAVKTLPKGAPIEVAFATTETVPTNKKDPPIVMKQIVLKAGGVTMRLRQQYEPDDFPVLPSPATEPKTIVEVSIAASTLASIVARTSHAVSSDETRPHLNSMLLESQGAVLRAVATDGHRLSLVESVGTKHGDFSTLVPQGALEAMTRIFDLGKGGGKRRAKADPLSVKIGQVSAYVTRGGVTYSFKRPGATFPPYQQVIPQRMEATFTTERAPLLEALKTLEKAASERTGRVKVTIESDRMVFKAEHPDYGETTLSVPGERAIDPDLELEDRGFNVRYLIHAIAAMESERVRFELSTGGLDPAILRPADRASPGDEIDVVMPMRI